MIMDKNNHKVILKAPKNPVMGLALQNAYNAMKIMEEHKTDRKKEIKKPSCMGAITNES